MNKKHTLKKTAAMLMALALSVGATSCVFISTDNAKDMARKVASVNITDYLSTVEGTEKDQADALKQIIDAGGLDTSIPKRDLIAYFLNYGYQYVQSYGYTYADTFNMLMDSLVSRKIMTQYAIVYYLSKEGYSAEDCITFIEDELKAVSGREQDLLKTHPEISVMKYFLTRGGDYANNPEEYDKALYTLKKSINDSLDSTESSYIEASTETHDHGEIRTTPTNVGTEKEDYYVKPTEVNGEIKTYEVYTGRNDVSACYGYETVEGSTRMTRMKAYNKFLANLQANNLLLADDNMTKLTEMDYYYVEFASQLEQALITMYTDDLAAEGEKDLTDGNSDSYLAKRYEAARVAQKEAYDKDYTAFETDADAMSDTSFVMYSPEVNRTLEFGETSYDMKFGFVYNILIPFSQEQNDRYEAATARAANDSELYKYRASLLKEVTASDLRDSWFNEHEDENYAYQRADDKWYFFEDNLTNNEKYESLSMYLGDYAYNGSVMKKADGTYALKANKLPFYDATEYDFLEEMERYMRKYAYTKGDVNTRYVSADSGEYTLDEKTGEFADYSQFVFYEGKVEVGKVSLDDYFVKDTLANRAASAFNELMFAYSTDTGCLNTYLGYFVSPYSTSFVPEFEYAAQYAISKGTGTYVVCPSTYGWHIIYVTYAFEAGNVYKGFDVDQVGQTGTFSDLYYESMRESRSSDFANVVQTDIIEKYYKDECVTLYKDAYQDLLDLDNQ